MFILIVKDSWDRPSMIYECFKNRMSIFKEMKDSLYCSTLENYESYLLFNVLNPGKTGSKPNCVHNGMCACY